MHKIHLPHYIDNSKELHEIISSSKFSHLVVAKVKNYRLLETLIGYNQLAKTILSITNDISSNYANCKTKSVEDYLFFFSTVDLSSAAQQLNQSLYDSALRHSSFHIEFQITFTSGDLKTKLPSSVQSLLYSSPNKDDSNDAIMKEYAILNLLKHAIANKTAGFAYQPIIDSKSGVAIYHECLMRIPDENGVWISAGPAILLAEKYGIIDIVDNAVIEMAKYELEASKDILVSVNISNIGLLDDKLLAKIMSNFKKREFAERLILEITETSLNENIEKTVHFINNIRALGIRVAIDDFGVGVRSFEQLCSMKFDVIKIDGSFIKDIATNPYNRFIVELVVKLAHETGAKTVAEFVENGTIAKYLMELNVDFMQGHFFSPAQNFRSW